jgi:hypothetical protein
LSYQVLGAAELEAMDWVRSNTDKGDRFLVLDEQGNPLLSPLTEWFPALADRRSINTIQGTEWLAGNMHYNSQYSLITDIHQCLYKDVTCLRDLQGQMTDHFDFIVVSSNTQIPLLYSLDQSPDFKLVYSSLPIRIYQVDGQ